MKNDTKRGAEVAAIERAAPLVDLAIILGRDGSIAISIEPRDTHPAIVAGALEMAKSAILLNLSRTDNDTQASRHADRRVKRESRNPLGGAAVTHAMKGPCILCQIGMVERVGKIAHLIGTPLLGIRFMALLTRRLNSPSTWN